MHSCSVVPLEEHFVGKPTLIRQLYDELLQICMESGCTRVDSLQTAIMFAHVAMFAEIAVQKTKLKLLLILPEKIDDPALYNVRQRGKKWWIHYLNISCREDIDEQLAERLTLAYDLAS